MSLFLSDIKKDVAAKAQDDKVFLTIETIDYAVSDAIIETSMDKPLEKVETIAGDDTQDYPLPSGFIKGISDISEVETPSGENPPVYRDRYDDWSIYEDSTKAAGLQMRLRFIETTPTSTETIRIVYTTAHTVTNTTTTLNQKEYYAVVAKSLQLSFLVLASKFTQSSMPTIDADTVDFGLKNNDYLSLASRWEARYKRAVGLTEVQPPAQSLREIDLSFAGGQDMIFHRGRYH